MYDKFKKPCGEHQQNEGGWVKKKVERGLKTVVGKPICERMKDKVILRQGTCRFKL